MAVIFEGPYSGEPLKEFVGTGPTGLRVRSKLTSPTTLFEILNVTCTYPKVFSDLTITWELLTSFVVTSTFSSAFDRTYKCLIQNSTTFQKTFQEVTSLSTLPANFKGIVSVTSTQQLINIPFVVTYRDQEGSPTWSANKTTTWNLRLAINEGYTAQAVKTAVQQGSGYQTAIIKYPEATLPPVT